MSFIIPVISSNLEVNNFSRDYVQAQRLNDQGTGKTSVVSLTRPLSAITIGSDGYYTWVPASQPRWGYDPVTKQPLGWYIASTSLASNVLLYSEDFSQSYWTKQNITISPNTSFVSPSGNFSSYEINEGTSTGQHAISALTNYQPITAYPNYYTISVFARAGTCDRLQIIFDNDNWVFGPDRWATFDLTNGTVSNNPANLEAYINPAGNGWYKLMLASPMSATNYNLQFINTGVKFAMCSASNSSVKSPSYTGTGRNMYLWGAHYYRGTINEYTPTYGLSAALPPGLNYGNGSGDWTTIGTMDSTIYQNNSAGTLFLEYIQYGRQFGAMDNIFSFNSDQAKTIIGFGGTDVALNIGARYQQNGTNLFSTNTNINAFRVVKAAFAWTNGSQAIALNGTIVGTGTVAQTITNNGGGLLGAPYIASYFVSGTRNGWYRKLRYYPYRLPNQVLIGLTR
jgi:hypothetical protein